MSAPVAHASLDPLPLQVTFSRIMCSGLGVIFPCSSAGPWVPCVGLHYLVHLVSGLREREVRQEERSMPGSPSQSLALIDCGGAGSVALAPDTWEEMGFSGAIRLVFVLYSTSCRAAKAGPHTWALAAEVG